MIKLTERYSVTSDGLQYILGIPTPVTDKNGKTTIQMRYPRYYSTMSQAVSACLESVLREGVQRDEVTTLEGFISLATALNTQMKDLIEKAHQRGNADEPKMRTTTT